MWYYYNFQFVADGGSTVGGDDTSFWSNSPSRSDSPSPNTIPNSIGGTYQIYTQVGCSTPSRYTPYRSSKCWVRFCQPRDGPDLGPVDFSAYPSITADSDVTTHIHTAGPFVRVVKRRSTANKKERRRTQSINNAYADLRDCIPNVPADTKLSKVR